MDKNYYDIDVFDAYLNGTMSDAEKSVFEAQLKADKNLSQEFAIHKEIIAGIQRAGANADLEFENALLHLSDEEMEKIVERRTKANKTTPQGRVVPMRKIYGWVAAAAAVVFIAGVGGYQYQQQQTKNKLCDAIFTAGFNPDMTMTRSGDISESKSYSDAVNKLKNGETESAINALEKLYEKADDDMKIEYGTSLAYAYVKAHNLEKAWDIINKVKSISQRLYGETPIELESLIQAMNGQNLK